MIQLINGQIVAQIWLCTYGRFWKPTTITVCDIFFIKKTTQQTVIFLIEFSWILCSFIQFKRMLTDLQYLMRNCFYSTQIHVFWTCNCSSENKTCHLRTTYRRLFVQFVFVFFILLKYVLFGRIIKGEAKLFASAEE